MDSSISDHLRLGFRSGNGGAAGVGSGRAGGEVVRALGIEAGAKQPLLPYLSGVLGAVLGLSKSIEPAILFLSVFCTICGSFGVFPCRDRASDTCIC